MRTGGQGQAAVPRERVLRRRLSGLPGPRDLGRRENIPRTVTTVVERYPDFPGLRGVRYCHGARFAHRGFSFAQRVRAAPNTIWREYK